MIDNLKDAITHAREVASKQRRRFEDIYGQEEQTEAERKEAIACLDCSNEHGLLAAWLEELQERREKDTDCVEWETTVHGVLAYKVCSGCKAEYLFDLTYGWKLCPKCGAKIKGGAV